MINRFSPFYSLLLVAMPVVASAAGTLTVQVGSPPPAPTPLVTHSDTWHYRAGTNEPASNWATVADAELDATWLTAAGGFGYGDPGIANEATTLTDMLNGYSTLYIRRSFNIASAVDANAHLFLTVDYDDGFVAYLDGVELKRENLTNMTAGTFVVYNSTIGVSHEASCCNAPTHPATVYDLGAVGTRLDPGTHVLAIHGVNQAANSSDFHLIADFSLKPVAPGIAAGGPFFALVNTNTVPLLGSNTVAGSTRVAVNGLDGAFNSTSGTWSYAQTLALGMNHLFIAALDTQGNLLASTNRDVLVELTSTSAGGILGANTAWSGGVVRVTNTLTVPAGVTLDIGPGTVVLLSPNASIRATTNGVVNVAGTEGQPAYFLPADGLTPWGDVAALGTNASLTLRYAEVVAGQVRAVNGGTVLVEDCVARDLTQGAREIVAGVNGGSLTVRRSYLTRFNEVDARETPVLIEDSLFERFFIDGGDIKATNAPLVVRRSTYRLADQNPINDADGLDFGPGRATVERCLIHDMQDKGVSIGGDASGTTISETVIYHCGIGISAYASSNCVYLNNTISGCANGLLLRNNPTPGIASGTNLIVWGNVSNVVISGTARVELSYSDVQSPSVFPGLGNNNVDPQFVDAANHDFRLSTGSPLRGTGLDGADMGAIFPVGGIPPAPFELAAVVDTTNPIELRWREDADNENGFLLERSTDGASWQALASVAANVTSYSDARAALGQRYFYRAQATNDSGRSRYSNPASAIRQEPLTIAGGTLTSDTVWSPAMGTILVLSDVIVPTNVKLTMLPGTLVRLTNNAAIRAQAGGAIEILGTVENKVVLERLNGANNWAELTANGANASLTVRHADISGGQTTVHNGATGVLEDSYFHDFVQQGAPTTFNQPILLTSFAAPSFVRRCIVRDYYETLWRHGLNTIEDCLFEDMVGDALDFDAAVAGLIIRRCTFRDGHRGNVDAIDIGNDGASVSLHTTIESCLMYGFPFDKGVSIGEESRDIVVTNCFMYECLWGIGVKDSSTVGLYNNTIVNCDVGFRLYNKIAGTGSGLVTNSFNNILWANTNSNLLVLDGGQIVANYSDVGGTNWPGTGNLDADPLFVNLASRDCRLDAGSPCLGTGRGGADMGAHFPVGALMAPSHPIISSIDRSGSQAILRFWVDSHRSYSVLSSEVASGGQWSKVEDIYPTLLPRQVTITNSVPAASNRFYRLVSPAMP